ncbi:MAG: sodium-independent anion transporter, partial [Thiohalophilus sp.]|uniref:sodium-independent anion transporter n=1 Tax=Thiohalophilus sp. TaxID=3028392 RepID=UPI00286FE661
EKKPLAQCPQLKIIRIDMSIYFGSLTNIQRLLNQISDEEGINHILIISTGINFIDMAGAEMLVQEAQRLKQRGGGLYFTDNKSRVCRFLRKGHFIEAIGEDHFFATKQEAISHIFGTLNHKICARCDKRIFKECATVPQEEPVASLHPEPKEG